MVAAGNVDDAEPPHAQRGVVRAVEAVAVRPAVNDGLAHGAHGGRVRASPSANVYHSRNATHNRSPLLPTLGGILRVRGWEVNLWYTGSKRARDEDNMKRYALGEAQTRLKQLIDAARSGEIILITDENNEGVQLVPVAPQQKPRRAGSARGQIKMSPDFDAPLPDFDAYTE